MAGCAWGHEDCRFEGSEKCDTCFSDSFHYSRPRARKKATLARHQQKKDSRLGSGFEYRNHKANETALADTVVSRMTVNSGATVLEKGDEQIRGLVNAMEELKTRTTEQAPGRKTFTIQKQWLDKLHNEAMKENMEFWYLKFSFFESDNDVYCITEQDIIMSMIRTMKEDRLRTKKAAKEIDVANRMRAKAEAELLCAKKEIELLRAQIELNKDTEL